MNVQNIENNIGQVYGVDTGWMIYSYSNLLSHTFSLFCDYSSNIQTRGRRTLALCLTAAVGIPLAIFCRLVSTTHCCRLNQLKSGFALKQHPTMHVSILDYIPHLNFDLSGSLKVKCDSVTGLPIYGFLFMFNSNGLTQLLYEI